MIDTLGKRQRQALALLILIIVIAAIAALVGAPLWSLNNRSLETIDRLDQRLQILQRKVARGDELRDRHAQLKQMLASNRHYLKSSTEALAAADLQGIIKRNAQLTRTEVVSTQIMPTSSELGFSAVTLKVRMRGKLVNFVRIFHALETGQPYLFMDNLSIRSRIQHSRKIDFEGGENTRVIDSVQMLDVEFDVTGYMPQQAQP